MCLVAIGIDAHPHYRLVIAANRDEEYVRPAARAAFWDDAPEVLAGRDLEAGGTWLGVARSGRLAALTNYYGPDEYASGKRSRGGLVSGFLRGSMTREGYLEELQQTAGCYNGFSLVFGDGTGLSYFSNRGDAIARIPAGIHGLSNHLLNTLWPKVAAAKAGLRRVVERGEVDPEEAFGFLADRTRYPDHLLPDTGVPLERERGLSSAFVTLDEFGTRCSSLILVDRKDRITFIERSFDRRQRETVTVRYTVDRNRVRLVAEGEGRTPLPAP